MSVLVWIETRDGQAVTSSWEVVGAARQLAAELGTDLTALVMGANTREAAAEVGRYGVDTLYTLQDERLAQYTLSAYAEGLLQAVEASGATVVLAAATTNGREVIAAVACDLECGLAADAVDLRVEGGELVATRAIYANNLLADVTFVSPIQFATVRPRSFPLPEPGEGQAVVEALTLGAVDIPETVEKVEAADQGEISLTDARIVVSGGRGVAADPEKGFALVRDLADVLGAAVGASRAAVDAGYVPYAYQVGQTGKTVKPDLYIAAGISGAIQHLAGMGGSKVIVALNQDPNAAIFSRAHYGVVGDLYQLLPALTEEFRKRLGK